MRSLLTFASLALLLAVSVVGSQEKKKAIAEAVLDDPALPRVLIIGDSISIGYTPAVRTNLKGKANVHHNEGNASDTKNGVAKLKNWLGDGKWDVIHVNFGLHDIKFADGKHQVPQADYEKNLRSILSDLKATKAKIIWCSTTPVAPGTKGPGRKNEDVLAYNEAAKKIAESLGVPINDLYAFAASRLEKIQLPMNVHFTPEGSKALAGPVTEHILKALGK